MFRTLIGAIWAIDYFVANKRGRYASWTIIAFPMTFLTGIDRGLTYDADSFFRLTIMNSPSENKNNLEINFSDRNDKRD